MSRAVTTTNRTYTPRSQCTLDLEVQKSSSSHSYVTTVPLFYQLQIPNNESSRQDAIVCTKQLFHSIFIALGSNERGLHRSPAQAMRHIAAQLAKSGCHVERASSLYLTEPLGGGRQPAFVNAVLMVRAQLPPARLLALAKQLERAAGRRRGRRNGPRPIDIDILDYGGRIIGQSTLSARSGLVLPHPELHRRRFVLQPLLDVAPRWHHPLLDRSARQLLARLPARPGIVRRVLDSSWISCDEQELGWVGGVPGQLGRRGLGSARARSDDASGR